MWLCEHCDRLNQTDLLSCANCYTRRPPWAIEHGWTVNAAFIALGVLGGTVWNLSGMEVPGLFCWLCAGYEFYNLWALHLKRKDMLAAIAAREAL